MRRTIWGRVLVAAAATVTAVGASGCSSRERPAPDVVVGVPEESTTPETQPHVITGPADGSEEELAGEVFVDDPGGGPGSGRPEPGRAAGLAQPDGAPWPPPLPFATHQVVAPDLVFILVAGSDARPREDLLRSRADSIHLLAVNPATGGGTVVGIPRDSWVEIPGRGRGKINNALVLGGPDLLAATVRRLTGLPVHYYALTGFTGLAAMVDELGGVDVYVDRRMNDRVSGARFERGWHRFSGAEALAYTRNRNDVPNGDFSRSEHQGRLILAGLAKMRAEVTDDGGVARWIGVLLRHARLDVPPAKLPALGALARSLDPERLENVVAPGRIGTASRQSVVYLTKEAARLFEDLRDDAVVGGNREPAAATTRAPGRAADAATSTPPPGGGEATTTSNPPGAAGAGEAETTTTTGRDGDEPTTEPPTTTTTGRDGDEPTTEPPTTTTTTRRDGDEPTTEPPSPTTTSTSRGGGNGAGGGADTTTTTTGTLPTGPGFDGPGSPPPES